MTLAVVLPLSGPQAPEAQAALRAIEGGLRGTDVTLVVLDDRGDPSEGVRAAERARLERAVGILGLPSPTATTAVATRLASESVVIVSLAVAARRAVAEITRTNERTFVFGSLPAAHLGVIERYAREQRARRLAILYFGPASVAYGEDIATVLGRFGKEFETRVRVPLARPEAVVTTLTDLERERVDMIVGAVSEPVAMEVARRLRERRSTPAFLFSPPDLETRARVAAALLRDAIERRRARSADELRRAMEESPLVRKGERTIALDWDVTDVGVSKRGPFEASSSETRTCSCNSKDGRVCRQRSCLSRERCHKEEREDTCAVECVPG